MIEAEERENRLCELVDGTLVEKAMGFEERDWPVDSSTWSTRTSSRMTLAICVGADGMMRIAPGLVRIPDVSFITWDRLPGRREPARADPRPGARPGRRSAQRGEHQVGDGAARCENISRQVSYSSG